MEPALTLEALALRRAVAPRSDVSSTFVVLRLRAAKTRPGPRPRLGAVLALDTSGSMAGEKLEHVVRSAQRMAEILPETDRLGVVAFADEARVVSPLRALDEDGRREARAEIARLTAGGNTNVSAGLALASALFPDREEGERHVVVLMSDGQPNRGSTSSAALAREARELRAKARALSTLGFGADHVEDLLAAMADAGGGRYAFVSDPQLAQPSFARALGAQLDVVAERVELLVAPAEGVEIVRVLGEPKATFGAGGLRVTLPDAVAGDEIDVLVEVKMAAPREPGPWDAARIELTARAAGGKGELREARVVRVAVSSVGPHDEDPEAARVVAGGLAAELRLSALAAAERGQLAAAVGLLRKAKALLEATPGFDPDAKTPLNDAVEALVDDIAAMERVPDVEAVRSYKKAAYTHADFLMANARASRSRRVASAEEMTRATYLPWPEGARLVGLGALEGAVFPLAGGEIDIGRGGDNGVVLPSPSVSRRHVRIVSGGGTYWLIDLCSTAGTRVNGQPVQKHLLRPGDVIELGQVHLRYEA